jgi:hypothetical protein
VVALCKVAHVVTVRVHHYIAVGLLEAHEHIHHLELALDDNGRVVEDAHRGVCLLEHGMRVFGHIHWRDEGVLRVGRVGKGIGCCLDSRWLVRPSG